MEIAKNLAAGTSYPKGVVSLWPRLTTIFRAIADGNDDLGIPPYNGGLFDRAAAPILERSQLADNDLSAIIFALSHEQEGDAGRGPRYINYRDLSVQQLGSVYERLLEFQLKQEAGEVSVVLNAFGRKSSGSYYTPDELVKLIIMRTVGPLVDEADQAFRKEAEGAKKPAYLETLDPAQAILNLKVCDPAMGSGHFLVTLVDWMTDRVLEAMATAELLVPGYVSPVAARIDDIRTRILAQAEKHGWPIVKSHLDNRQVVRRMVLKRCVYGVDLNPMAVELAKVALWLHSFTVGAPLSFLDHHLICGNALFGERVRPVMDWAQSGNLLINDLTQRARGSVRGMQQVEEMTDADIAEARSSKTLFDEVRAVTHDLRNFMDLVHGVRWANSGNRVRGRAINRLQRGDFGSPIELLSGDIPPPAVSEAQHRLLSGKFEGPKASPTEKKALADAEDRIVIPDILEDVRTALGRERFLHWEVAFPGVWSDWESNEPKGGFDAVIGNPPWERMKFQEVEYFAARKPEIAMATPAADRKLMVEALLQTNDPLVGDYKEAVERAELSAHVARECGAFPLLSGGDVNLYSLFVERAHSIAKVDGIVGLLVPIGIGTDITSAGYISKLIQNHQLKEFISFENKRRWLFEDVHAEDQPTILIASNSKGRFPKFRYAVKLHAVPEDPSDLTVMMDAATLLAVNPNTGTMPIFRSSEDARVVASAYARVPIFSRKTRKGNVSDWPAKYVTMFHMTSASKLFRSKSALENEEGAWPVGRQRYQSPTGRWLPLYEGKSIQIFNHRYASIVTPEGSVSGQGQSVYATPDELTSPDFYTTPRYWVNESEVNAIKRGYAIGFNDVCNTNNERSLIAAIIPLVGAGNTLPLLDGMTASSCSLLIGNLNSIPCDYFARNKIQSRHLNKYILDQLPIIPPKDYQRRFGTKSADNIVRDEVLALSYTAHDLAAFAEGMGYVDPTTGEVKPPFAFKSKDRLRRRAKLDALYFMLYFPSSNAAEIVELRDTANYIYSTFPIVKREEEAARASNSS